MSNSSFSHLPEDPLHSAEPSLDLHEDPPVDPDLRAAVQRLSVGPTAEEQARFWGDLSKKLPEPKASAKTFAHLGVRRYLPWTALASGVVVVLMVWFQPVEEFSRQASLSDRAENKTAIMAEQEAPALKSEPMVLGAPPPAAYPTARSTAVPFGLTEPEFSVRWEQRSEQVFWVHVPTENEQRLLALAKQWPSGIVLSKVTEGNEHANDKILTYRLEDLR